MNVEEIMPRKAGDPVTPAMRAAGTANLAKGRKRKQEMAEQAKKQGRTTRGERWQALLSGQIKMADLDDEEVAKQRVRAKDGTFSGPANRLPSHLQQQFINEQIKRGRDKIREHGVKAIESMLEVADDPETPPSVRFAAYKFITEMALGKAPETIRHEITTEFEEMLKAAGGKVDLDREMEEMQGD